MSNYLTTDTDLIAVADAIRAKGGTSSSLSFPDGYVSAIQDIQTGGNFEDITISQDYLTKQNTVISNRIIFQTDETYPGTPVVLDNTGYANIFNGDLGQNGIGIKIELNRIYHCTGELKIEWSTGEQEIYSIDSDFTPTSYTTGSDVSFSWEGIETSNQTFNQVKLDFQSSSANGYKIFMRPSAVGAVTKSGVLLDGSYYQISVTSDGFNTINLNLSDDPRFQAIYKSLAYRSTIASSALGVSEWCDSLSKITFQQFAGQPFSGNFVFNNVSSIDYYAFGSVYTNIETGSSPYWTCSFPNCTTIRSGAFNHNTKITEVYFPQCSSTENYTFSNCGALTTVSFPNCTEIGIAAFYSCVKLLEVNFPNCVTIGIQAFQYCRSLITVNFPQCTSIKNNAFQFCSALTMVSFPNCTSIDKSAFGQCSVLTTVNFPQCTSIDRSAFYYCSALTTANFPQCISISAGAFSSCYSLSNISFPNCTYIGSYAFCSCSALTVISFPNCTSIESYAFRYCRNLSSFYFMGSYILSITNLTFDDTPLSLSSYLGYYGSIYVPASLLASYQTAQYWSQYSSRMVGI